MTYEHASGGVWQGVLSDGTVDLTKVGPTYLKVDSGNKPANNHYHTVIADILNSTRKQYHTKVPLDVQNGDSRNSQCCEPLCDFMYTKPICETYVLSFNGRKASSVIPPKAYAHVIIEELRDTKSNRFAIMVLSNCKDLEECNQKALAEIGFIPRPKQTYRHYRKFSNAARKLIEESIEYFEAPCCKLFEHLEQQGFTGDHVTYP